MATNFKHMKNQPLFIVLAFAFLLSLPCGAQINLNRLGKQIKQSAEQQVEQKVNEKAARETRKALDKGEKDLDDSVSKTKAGRSNKKNDNVSGDNEPSQNADIYYVSASTGVGSRTADGSQEKPYKDLQAAIDNAKAGALIRVAEGNYMGKMDQGFIEVNKYLSIEGGWNTDFTERDFVKYPTKIEPTEAIAQQGTSGAHALMDVKVRGNRHSPILIDGIIFNMGYYNLYCLAPNDDERAAAPEGCETGRLLTLDEKPNVPKTNGVPGSRQCLYGSVEGKLTVRNCVFANAMHYGIQMENVGGAWEFYNNIFVGCRMASCEVRGSYNHPEDQTTLDFHHNTVLFTWTRTKLLEDMGYGFRYMTGMNYNVHDNLFGGNFYGALDRTRFDTDLKREKIRVTNAYDNLFFANRMGDICLPSGGGIWNFQYAANFEEVEQLTKFEGNREVNAAEIETLKTVINDPYLKGYLGLTMSHKSSYSENSAMNTFRAAFGMNKQGTETVRVSMYANRYPIDDVPKLWGVITGKGAQAVR